MTLGMHCNQHQSCKHTMRHPYHCKLTWKRIVLNMGLQNCYSSSFILFCFIASCALLWEDLLSLYHDVQTINVHSLSDIRACQPVEYGNLTYEEFPASRKLHPSIEVKNLFQEYKLGLMTSHQVHGHYSYAEDPLATFSILEPGGIGGCDKMARSTVTDTSRQRNCLVAINAGFFKSNNGSCLGNIVTDGRFVNFARHIRNVNFGIRKDGSIVTGYLSEDMVSNQENPFVQLVTGVIWLVRNGNIYVDVSKQTECADLEETGPIHTFVNVLSGRTAIGHDAKGRVVLVQVDGRTLHRGMSLYTFAKLIQSLGVVNAINLDGGGSANIVINGTTVNYPSDKCDPFICEREVSTVACFHEPDCEPRDCHGHGVCQVGQCVCDSLWTGPACDGLLVKYQQVNYSGDRRQDLSNSTASFRDVKSTVGYQETDEVNYTTCGNSRNESEGSGIIEAGKNYIENVWNSPSIKLTEKPDLSRLVRRNKTTQCGASGMPRQSPCAVAEVNAKCDTGRVESIQLKENWRSSFAWIAGGISLGVNCILAYLLYKANEQLKASSRL